MLYQETVVADYGRSLTRIIGRIKASLYPGKREISREIRNKTVTDLAEQLQQWLDDTPSFFHPQNGEELGGQQFYKVDWILQRLVQDSRCFCSKLTLHQTAEDCQKRISFCQYATLPESSFARYFTKIVSYLARKHHTGATALGGFAKMYLFGTQGSTICW